MASVTVALASRTTAIVLMLLMIAALAASAFLPSQAFLTAEEWQALAVHNPTLFWLADRFSTTQLVKSPVFALLALFLFLSTLICTIRLVLARNGSSAKVLTKEAGFTFAVDGSLACSPTEAHGRAVKLLRNKGWLPQKAESGLIMAEKGALLAFWGSICLHMAIVICLLAAVLSYLYNFNGQMILTEGMVLPLREAVGSSSSGKATGLPAVQVKVENLQAVYKEGKFKDDFSGVLDIIDGQEKKYPFKVNAPAVAAGFQFSLQQMGFSPRLIITGLAGSPFDYHLNLRHDDGDYFPLDENNRTRLFVVFFPDFDQKDDGRIATLSRQVKNPRLLIKIMEGEKVLHRLLLAPGEKLQAGLYTVQFPELKRWVALSLSKEPGLPVLIVGLVSMILALFARFFGNERTVELAFHAVAGGSSFHLTGKSRYYPASLEREILNLAAELADKQIGGET